MERQSLLIVLLLSLAWSIVFLPSKSDADWAFSFVVWDGFIYIVSDDMVNQVGQEIGKVTRYSDMEGTYSGNFSNTYAKGTKYFSILNISTEEAIAIKNSDGLYVKAMGSILTTHCKMLHSKATNTVSNYFLGSWPFFQFLRLVATFRQILKSKMLSIQLEFKNPQLFAEGRACLHYLRNNEVCWIQ